MIRQFVVVHLWGKKSFIIKGYLRIIMEWKVKLHLPNVFRLRQLQVARLMILQLLGKKFVVFQRSLIDSCYSCFERSLQKPYIVVSVHSRLKAFSVLLRNWIMTIEIDLFYFGSWKCFPYVFFVENLHCI